MGNLGFSTGITGESDLPSCCEEISGVPFKSVQGNHALSRIEGKLRVLLNCDRNPGVPLEFQ